MEKTGKSGSEGVVDIPENRSVLWACMLCPAVFLCGLCILLLCVFAGCDEVVNHRVLTFFFEGVPPVDHAFRPAPKVRVVAEESAEGDVAVAAPSRLAQQKRGSRHPATRDCNKCHTGRSRRGRRELVKPPPGLCYTCHESHQIEEAYPHGPVTAGACVFCHDPHGSGSVHLQKAPQPDLCYRCHRREDMGTIVDHEDKLETVCTDCHDPHTSATKKLLKPYEDWVGDPNDLKRYDVYFEDPNSVK